MEIYLNLLPKEKKDAIKRKKLTKLIIGQELVIVLVALLFITVLFSVNLILSFQREAVLSESLGAEDERYVKMEKYEKLFEATNQKVIFINSLQKKHLYWSNLFLKFNDVVPDGILINEIANDNYKILVFGKADTRDILLAFKDKIGNNDCFENVNIPLSNIVVKKDIDFQIDFNIKKSCLAQ